MVRVVQIDMVEVVARVLEGRFFRHDEDAGTDAAQRVGFRDAARDVLAAINAAIREQHR